ncbi:MAG: hypothetical protein K2W95_34425 [Candidatus Obscuribacterales bacterium]|nr:hypothetical protein [Candidatus Obscuribacterales bacterium]
MDRWGKPKWARLTFIDDVEWSESQEAHYDDVWLRPDKPPPQGTARAIKLLMPPPQAPSFRVIFRPALSALNGWEEHPEEIESSALVEVEVQAKLENNWILVDVRNVLPFAELSDYFPPSAEDDIDELLDKLYASTVHVQSKNWHFVHSDIESDAGFWTVFTDDGVTLSILLYGHYMIGSAPQAYAGNRLLSDEEHQHILGILDERDLES